MPQQPKPAQPRLAVALVDDHEVIGAAIRAALAPTDELELVATAPTVDALLEQGTRWDLVVLDLRLADGSSPANNVSRLTEAGCNVIAFTSGESPYLLRAVARADVLGIVRKSEPMEAVTAALINAAHGIPVVTADWASTVESDPLIADARLSRQEERVLALFADGARAQSVADETGIAVSTLEDYVRRIRAKYARVGRPAHTKVDLYKRAVEDGFLPPPNS